MDNLFTFFFPFLSTDSLHLRGNLHSTFISPLPHAHHLCQPMKGKKNLGEVL
jgi:hypothetical protein